MNYCFRTRFRRIPSKIVESYKKLDSEQKSIGPSCSKTVARTQKKQVPSPRNLPIYKTNLTNRHEKILMSDTKVIIQKDIPKEFKKIFPSF